MNFIESNPEEVITLNEHTEIKSISFSNDLDYSSPDNSMNQNSFVFVTSEQFSSIAQNLDHKKPEQVKYYFEFKLYLKNCVIMC